MTHQIVLILCHIGGVFSCVVQSGTTDVVLHAINSLSQQQSGTPLYTGNVKPPLCQPGSFSSERLVNISQQETSSLEDKIGRESERGAAK